LVSQLGCDLTHPIGQRTFDDVVAQNVDQRTDETITVRYQKYYIADVASKHSARCSLTTGNKILIYRVAKKLANIVLYA